MCVWLCICGWVYVCVGVFGGVCKCLYVWDCIWCVCGVYVDVWGVCMCGECMWVCVCVRSVCVCCGNVCMYVAWGMCVYKRECCGSLWEYLSKFGHSFIRIKITALQPHHLQFVYTVWSLCVYCVRIWLKKRVFILCARNIKCVYVGRHCHVTEYVCVCMCGTICGCHV